jgi:hypothetical protein
MGMLGPALGADLQKKASESKKMISVTLKSVSLKDLLQAISDQL